MRADIITSREGRFVHDFNGEETTIRWSIKLAIAGRNKAPYWSFTGDMYEGRRIAESKLLTCGAIGRQIAAIAPEFGVFERLHLSDSNGVPMYVEENGAYWLGLLSGEPQLGLAARHFRVTLDEVESLLDRILTQTDSYDGQMCVLRTWIDSHRERWQAESDEALHRLNAGQLRGAA